MEKKKRKPPENAPRVQDMLASRASNTDPNGSYTGVPIGIGETPVQDADDL